MGYRRGVVVPAMVAALAFSAALFGQSNGPAKEQPAEAKPQNAAANTDISVSGMVACAAITISRRSARAIRQ